jgi:hypothetical protein
MKTTLISFAMPMSKDKPLFPTGTWKCYVELISLFFLFLLASSCTSGHKIDPEKANHGNISSKGVSATKLQAAISRDFLIVPGQSIGRIQLSSNAESAYQLLGKADAGDAAMGKSIATWFFDKDSTKNLSIYTSRDLGVDNPPALIREIRVTAPRYRTADGIGPGSSKELAQTKYKLEAALPYQVGKDSVSLYFDRSGIGFEFYKDHLCRGILIYQKGVLSPNNYLKFIP